MDTQSLTVVSNAQHLMPAMGIDQVIYRRNVMTDFVSKALIEGTDFGVIPGTNTKPVLLKPGAEKLNTLFGFTSRPVVVEKVEDWTGKDHDGEPFFYYWYRYQLWRGDILIAEADGSCNSMEKKYRWRWVPEAEVPAELDKTKLKTQGGAISEFAFAVDKAETSGQYGKPAAYWKQFQDAIANGTARPIKKKTRSEKMMDAWEIGAPVYRIPNTEIPDLVNTLQKMAQKRALVAATLLAVNASEFFTQDLEDQYIEGNYQVVVAQPAAQPAPVKPAPVADAKAAQSDWLDEQIADAERTVATPAPQQNGNGNHKMPAIKTSLWKSYILSRAAELHYGYGMNDKEPNAYRLLNAAVDGGFTEKEITDTNYMAAWEAIERHYKAKQEPAL